MWLWPAAGGGVAALGFIELLLGGLPRITRGSPEEILFS